MRRLIARKITGFDEAAEKFIQNCKDSGDFDWYQMEQIRLGLKNGLTMEQIKFYADPKFAWNQMEQIREDFENGMSIEEIKKEYGL